MGLETAMGNDDSILDCVYFLHYKCFKINFKRGGFS